jgi:hypothetical protein
MDMTMSIEPAFEWLRGYIARTTDVEASLASTLASAAAFAELQQRLESEAGENLSEEALVERIFGQLAPAFTRQEIQSDALREELEFLIDNYPAAYVLRIQAEQAIAEEGVPEHSRDIAELWSLLYDESLGRDEAATLVMYALIAATTTREIRTALEAARALGHPRIEAAAAAALIALDAEPEGVTTPVRFALHTLLLYNEAELTWIARTRPQKVALGAATLYLLAVEIEPGAERAAGAGDIIEPRGLRDVASEHEVGRLAADTEYLRFEPAEWTYGRDFELVAVSERNHREVLLASGTITGPLALERYSIISYARRSAGPDCGLELRIASEDQAGASTP